MDVELRRADLRDADTLAALATQVFLDSYATEGVRPDLAREVLREFSAPCFAERLADARRQILLATAGDAVRGFAEVLLGANETPAGGREGSELVRLYVQPRHQGRGVGRRLLEAVESEAPESGCVWLTAWEGNDRAIRFYLRQGYDEIGETDHTIEDRAYRNFVFAKCLPT